MSTTRLSPAKSTVEEAGPDRRIDTAALIRTSHHARPTETLPTDDDDTDGRA
jgi:hypothetical protein